MYRFITLLMLLFCCCAECQNKELRIVYTGKIGSQLQLLPPPSGIRLNVSKKKTEQIVQGLKDGSYNIAVMPERPSGLRNFRAVPFALKGMILAVNPGNSLRNITEKQVRDIVEKHEGSWRTFNGPMARIHLYIKTNDALPPPIIRRTHTHATHAAHGSKNLFEFKVQKNTSKTNYAKPLRFETESDSKSFTMLFTDPHGMACFDLTRYDEDRVPLLKVNGIPPTLDNFKAGSYPLLTTWYLVLPLNPTAAEKEITDHLYSESFLLKLFEGGYLPFPRKK